MKKINAGGINGLGKGTINVNSADFKRLQEMIKERSARQADKVTARKENRNIEIAKTLKKNGIAIEIRIQSTGLLKEEIEKL